ncbi:hypothetical protein NI389_10055 [Pseudoalteromonas xiamenensis]|uniref:hypothetical protein n=1 Tax=Pseudoalteromonas xiamenensis TaxID=882626 RepID=UPI0027E5030D|nr:hypothetical protein [Pseudoalteromonas xiamenensis]WMN58601.1 hypothetical protein NI389_10055 [Pseudoalteromonas xiamenensis]
MANKKFFYSEYELARFLDKQMAVDSIDTLLMDSASADCHLFNTSDSNFDHLDVHHIH